MNPASVFSLSRPLRSARVPFASRLTASLAAAAALLLPAAGLRAQAPGTLDTSFVNGGNGSTIYAVDYETDTNGVIKVTVGGDRDYGFYLVTGDPGVADVQPNGPSRTDFLFPDFGNPGRIIYTIVPEQVIAPGTSLPNLLLGGSFGQSVGQIASRTAGQNIVRITPDGTLDTSFVSGVGGGANNFVTAILPLADGRIVVGGQFTVFNKETRRRVVRLLNNGAIDESFATGSNIDNDVITLAASLDPATGLADGSTLVAGIFNHVAGQSYSKLVRLDANGNLDMTFHPSIDLRVLSILVQPTGKIVIGGDFTNVNGVSVAHLARLNPDGSLDTTFAGSVTGVPNNDVNPTAVYVLKPLSDGRIYVGGEFAQINGTARRYLGLISVDGVLDTSFDPGTTMYDSVQTIAIQSDNNLLIGETLGPKIGKNIQPSLVRLFGVTPNSAIAPIITPVTLVQHVQPATTKVARARAGKPVDAQRRQHGASLHVVNVKETHR